MGFLGDVLNYKMDWPFLLTISGLAVVGILVGNAWSRRVNSVALRKAFGWFTLAMGIFIVIKELTQA
jgi:uncharacterized membrane protein YfcA